jgi:hypothetical protein
MLHHTPYTISCTDVHCTHTLQVLHRSSPEFHDMANAGGGDGGAGGGGSGAGGWV